MEFIGLTTDCRPCRFCWAPPSQTYTLGTAGMSIFIDAANAAASLIGVPVTLNGIASASTRGSLIHNSLPPLSLFERIRPERDCSSSEPTCEAATWPRARTTPAQGRKDERGIRVKRRFAALTSPKLSLAEPHAFYRFIEYPCLMDGCYLRRSLGRSDCFSSTQP
jgi:hypothetical protein